MQSIRLSSGTPCTALPRGRSVLGRDARGSRRLIPVALRLALVIGGPLWLAPAQAAQEDAGKAREREEAKGHFQRGAAAYKAGSYREAHDEFLQAYNLTHLQDLLYNLAVAAEHMGRPDM